MPETSTDATEISMTQRNRAVRILAKSIYRQLTEQGYDEKQIVSLATELIGAVTREMEDPTAQP